MTETKQQKELRAEEVDHLKLSKLEPTLREEM
jgi:hypothetical protein